MSQQDQDYQPRAKVIEYPMQDESTGFDYRTHVKDAKTGKLIRLQTYARHSRGAEVLLERPVGSGNCFFENGISAGNWDIKEWRKLSDEHKATAPTPANHLEDLQQKNAALEAELAALKADAEAAQKKHKGNQVQKT